MFESHFGNVHCFCILVLMRIKNLIIYSKLLPPEHVGGVEINAYYLIKQLTAAKTFDNIYVLTQRKRKRFFSRAVKLDYNFRNKKAFVITKKESKCAKKVLQCFRMFRLKPNETVIYHNALDLYKHYHLIKDDGFIQVARSGGNDFFYCQKKNNSSDNFLDSLNSLDKIILNSNFSFERIKKSPLPTHLFSLIKGGCESYDRPHTELANLPGDPNAPLIISCCRLVDFKALDDAIDAMYIIKNRGVKFRYLIVGEGKLRNNIEAQIREKNLNDCCFLVGQKTPDQVQRYYCNSDIYLSTSKDVLKTHNNFSYVHTETMGRSICEAQVNGLPVVTTNTGGSPEMIKDGHTGIVVEPGNATSIASALIDLLINSQLRETYSKNAQKYSEENFTWPQVVKKTLRIIQSLPTT